jgi:DNA-binding transcriptional regulator YhcF (GntR family)
LSRIRHASLVDHGLQVVKDRLLTDTHLGRLRPGRRVPSVRRMAQLTGLDRKAVHRAYLKLVAEGLLRTRPGCGTFISEETVAGLTPVPAAELLGAIERCLADAASLGLSPAVFGQLLAVLVGDGLRGYPVAIAECDHEQIGLIAGEVHGATGVAVHPMLLRDFSSDPGRVLRQVHAVVGTSCHRDDVLALAAPFGLPVHWVVQDPTAATAFLERARHGRVLMVVHDTHCASGFRRLLRELRTPEETIERFEFVSPPDAPRLLQQLDDRDSVYISPLVDPDRIAPLPPPRQRIPPPPYLEHRSLEQLRVRLAMDMVGQRMRRHAAAGDARSQVEELSPPTVTVARARS